VRGPGGLADGQTHAQVSDRGERDEQLADP
jgi:hypothetical protein